MLQDCPSNYSSVSESHDAGPVFSVLVVLEIGGTCSNQDIYQSTSWTCYALLREEAELLLNDTALQGYVKACDKNDHFTKEIGEVKIMMYDRVRTKKNPPLAAVLKIPTLSGRLYGTTPF